MNRLAPYWKAFVAFVAPGAVVLGSSVLDGSDGGSTITLAEIVTASVACIVSAAAVYRVPNVETENDRRDDAGQEEPLDEKPVDSDGYIGEHEAGR